MATFLCKKLKLVLYFTFVNSIKFDTCPHKFNLMQPSLPSIVVDTPSCLCPPRPPPFAYARLLSAHWSPCPPLSVHRQRLACAPDYHCLPGYRVVNSFPLIPLTRRNINIYNNYNKVYCACVQLHCFVCNTRIPE